MAWRGKAMNDDPLLNTTASVSDEIRHLLLACISSSAKSLRFGFHWFTAAWRARQTYPSLLGL